MSKKVMTRWKGHPKKPGAGSIYAPFFVGFLIFSTWGGYHFYRSIIFSINCKEHLKLAADANTIERARERLGMALEYIEDNGLTSGFTSVLYEGPQDDVGFWYDNLTDAKTELDQMPEDATRLERSNMLMKLRETLLDDTGSGVTVTVPPGISVYPNNVPVAIWGVIVFSVFSFCCLISMARAHSQD